MTGSDQARTFQSSQERRATCDSPARFFGVLAFGIASFVALSWDASVVPSWQTLLLLTAAAAATDLALANGNQSRRPLLSGPYLLAGILLLPASAVAILVLTIQLVTWLRSDRGWRFLVHDSCVTLTGVAVAYFLNAAIETFAGSSSSGPVQLVGAIAAAATLTVVCRLINGLFRHASTRASLLAHDFAVDSVLTQFVVLLFGLPIAVFWRVNPWLIIAALAPLVLMHRALNVPDLEKEARTDTKTGLHNMRSLNEALSRELQRATRFGHSVSLLMVDLDLLRHVNNSYGHQVGDNLLRGIADVIRGQIREYDVAARFGGDEFIVLLVECDSDRALQVAERMRRMVEDLRFEAPTSLGTIGATVSIGAASFPRHGSTQDELIYQADLAVYRAKLGGRNRVCLAPPPNRPPYAERDAEDEGVPVGFAEAEVRLAAPVPASAATPASAAQPDDSAARKRPTPAPSKRRLGDVPFWLQLLMAAVILLSLSTVVGALPKDWDVDWVGLAGLVLLTLAAEAWVVDIYGESSVSLMVIPTLAGAMLFGVPGGAVMGLTAAVSRGVMRHSAIHRVAFNAAVFVLGAALASLVFQAAGAAVTPSTLPGLLLPALVAAIVYYITNTSLISLAMGLSSDQRPAEIWREQFRWLFVHYAVFGVLGLFLAAAYAGFGLYGLLAFAAPAFALRYTMHQYISSTTEHVSELRRLNFEMQRSNDEMARINEDLLNTLAAAIDVRDPFVYGHSSKVAEYAVAIAAEMSLGGEMVELIRQAGLLHDIGKLGISESILHKPARLDPDEYEQVKTHATLGADLLGKMRRLQHLIPAIKHHHEWYNGAGYPDGLSGTEIPIEARVLAVCDAIEAMASDRPYHRALPEEQIIAELQRCSGTQFDPEVVQAFVNVARSRRGLVSNSAQDILQREGVVPAASGAKHLVTRGGTRAAEILFGSAAFHAAQTPRPPSVAAQQS